MASISSAAGVATTQKQQSSSTIGYAAASATAHPSLTTHLPFVNPPGHLGDPHLFDARGEHVIDVDDKDDEIEEQEQEDKIAASKAHLGVVEDEEEEEEKETHVSTEPYTSPAPQATLPVAPLSSIRTEFASRPSINAAAPYLPQSTIPNLVTPSSSSQSRRPSVSPLVPPPAHPPSSPASSPQTLQSPPGPSAALNTSQSSSLPRQSQQTTNIQSLPSSSNQQQQLQVQAFQTTGVSKEELTALQTQFKVQQQQLQQQLEQQFKISTLELKNAVYCANLERDIKSDELEIAQIEIEILQEELQLERQANENQLSKLRADMDSKLNLILSNPSISQASGANSMSSNIINQSADTIGMSELRLENGALMDQLLEAETANEALEDEVNALRALREIDKQLIDLDKVLINELSIELSSADLLFTDTRSQLDVSAGEVHKLLNLIAELRRKLETTEKEKEVANAKVNALQDEIQVMTDELLNAKNGSEREDDFEHTEDNDVVSPTDSEKLLLNNRKKMRKQKLRINDKTSDGTVEEEITNGNEEEELLESSDNNNNIGEETISSLNEKQKSNSRQSLHIVERSIRRSMGILRQTQSRAVALAESISIVPESFADIEYHPAVIELRGKLSSLREENMSKDTEVSEKVSEVKEKLTEIRFLESKISALELSLSTAQNRVAASELITMNAQATLNEHAVLKLESQHASVQIVDLTSKLSASLSEISHAKEENSTLRKAYDDLRDDAELKSRNRKGGFGNFDHSNVSFAELEGLKICLQRTNLELQKLQLDMAANDLQIGSLSLPIECLMSPLPDDHPCSIAAVLEGSVLSKTAHDIFSPEVAAVAKNLLGSLTKEVASSAVNEAANSAANMCGTSDSRMGSTPGSPSRDTSGGSLLARRSGRLSSFARGGRVSSMFPGAYLPPNQQTDGNVTTGSDSTTTVCGTSLFPTSSQNAKNHTWSQLELECLPAWRRMALDRLKAKSYKSTLMASGLLSHAHDNQNESSSQSSSLGFNSADSAKELVDGCIESLLDFQKFRKHVLLSNANSTVVDLTSSSNVNKSRGQLSLSACKNDINSALELKSKELLRKVLIWQSESYGGSSTVDPLVLARLNNNSDWADNQVSSAINNNNNNSASLLSETGAIASSIRGRFESLSSLSPNFVSTLIGPNSNSNSNNNNNLRLKYGSDVLIDTNNSSNMNNNSTNNNNTEETIEELEARFKSNPPLKGLQSTIGTFNTQFRHTLSNEVRRRLIPLTDAATVINNNTDLKKNSTEKNGNSGGEESSKFTSVVGSVSVKMNKKTTIEKKISLNDSKENAVVQSKMKDEENEWVNSLASRLLKYRSSHKEGNQSDDGTLVIPVVGGNSVSLFGM